jgi:hypothetical protein
MRSWGEWGGGDVRVGAGAPCGEGTRKRIDHRTLRRGLCPLLAESSVCVEVFGADVHPPIGLSSAHDDYGHSENDDDNSKGSDECND